MLKTLYGMKGEIFARRDFCTMQLLVVELWKRLMSGASARLRFWALTWISL